MHKKCIGLSGLIVSLCCLCGTAFAEIAVIIHTSNGNASLTKSQVKAIYLKKKKTFPNSTPVIPCDQPEGSGIRNNFIKEALNKNQRQLTAYWTKRIFSGKGTPPEVIGGDEEIKAWVAKTPNALGYIDASAVDSSVKVLLRLP